MFNAFGNYSQCEVGFSGSGVALQNLWSFDQGLLDVIDHIGIAAFDRDIDEGAHFEAKGTAIQLRGVAADNAAFFQCLDASPAGGGGHVDLLGKLLGADATVLLQCLQYLPVLPVQVNGCHYALIFNEIYISLVWH